MALTQEPDGFWRGTRVLVTGHTGFKGAWLTLWLHRLGADVSGYALAPPPGPSAFALAGVDEIAASQFADIRDASRLRSAFERHRPRVVFHLAAQALVRAGYKDPEGTYETNAVGTANVLAAARACGSVAAFVVVTSDKCYDPRAGAPRHAEGDPLGGDDPYSASKACAEYMTAALRTTWLADAACTMNIATARAGNVVGGGDWSVDRLVPDALAAFDSGLPLLIRNPAAVRPWQYVLDPLAAYLDLARRLTSDGGAAFARAWNFGPPEGSERAVSWVADRLAEAWGGAAAWRAQAGGHPPETQILRLDSSAAAAELGWQTRVDLTQALALAVRWHRDYRDGLPVRDLMLSEIARYAGAAAA